MTEHSSAAADFRLAFPALAVIAILGLSIFSYTQYQRSEQYSEKLAIAYYDISYWRSKAEELGLTQYCKVSGRLTPVWRGDCANGGEDFVKAEEIDFWNSLLPEGAPKYVPDYPPLRAQ